MSYHGLDTRILFSAVSLKASFSDKDSDEPISSRSGSGFFFATTNNFYLVTNLHMVDIDFRSKTDMRHTKLSEIRIGQVGWDMESRKPSLYKETIIKSSSIERHPDPEVDIAVVINPIIELKDFHSSIPHFLSNQNLPSPAEWELVEVCDQVFFPSYNKFHDKKNNFPLVRSGIIASFPGVNYSFSEHANYGKIIALEAFSHGGSSGAPVFADSKGALGWPKARKGFLAGIIAGHLAESGYNREVKSIEEIHSGISYMYPVSEIIKLIESVDSKYKSPKAPHKLN